MRGVRLGAAEARPPQRGARPVAAPDLGALQEGVVLDRVLGPGAPAPSIVRDPGFRAAAGARQRHEPAPRQQRRQRVDVTGPGGQPIRGHDRSYTTPADGAPAGPARPIPTGNIGATGSIFQGGDRGTMRAVKKMRGALWRMVEWSTVMAALCWFFARAWTDEARHQKRLRDGRAAAAAEKPSPSSAGAHRGLNLKREALCPAQHRQRRGLARSLFGQQPVQIVDPGGRLAVEGHDEVAVAQAGARGRSARARPRRRRWRSRPRARGSGTARRCSGTVCPPTPR